LGVWLKELGEPRFRVSQIYQWLWAKGGKDFVQMTNLSLKLRQQLAQNFIIRWPKLAKVQVSQDGTRKFVLVLDDEKSIESVLIPERDHYTLCLSSQVGCVMSCRFCHTGQMGFERNLEVYEILAQVVLAREYVKQENLALPLRNIVFMGMGEPLLNWSNLEKSLHLLRNDKYFNFSRRRLTVSTVGIKDKLKKFGQSRLGMLAFSLHAPNQTLRKQLMPKAANWELKEIIAALRNYPLEKRERITIEYVLLDRVNDSRECALQLAKLLSGLRCKVNLISYNPWPGSLFARPKKERILAFEQVLWSKGITAILRKSKGDDILAACGQLRTAFAPKSAFKDASAKILVGENRQSLKNKNQITSLGCE